MTDLLTRLIRWPLWSWRNLTVTVVLALATMAGLGRAGAALNIDQPGSTPSPSPSQPQTAAHVPTPGEGRTSSTSTSTATSTPPLSPTMTAAGGKVDDCRQAADLFVRAWARPSLSSAAWLAGLRPYAAHSLLEKLVTSDPARVPATQVLTEPQAVKDSNDGKAFRIVTDAGPVIVLADKTEGVCVIRDLRPDNDVAGAPTPSLGPVPATSRTGE